MVRQQSEKQKVLNRMIASIPLIMYLVLLQYKVYIIL